MAGQKTLLVDLDPQCNATSGLGHKPDERHALLDSRPLRESFRETYLPNLSLLPGARSFEDVDALANSSRLAVAHAGDPPGGQPGVVRRWC